MFHFVKVFDNQHGLRAKVRPGEKFIFAGLSEISVFFRLNNIIKERIDFDGSLSPSIGCWSI